MSSEPIIRVEGLGKRYTLRHEVGGARYRRLSEELIDAVRRPLAYLRGATPPPDPTRDEFWALRDVSFDVREGEVLGIIGRNGAGKSTLLKILSRITEPSEGRVTLRGRVASLLEVGTGFHPELTGRENIYLNGAILGMSRAEITRKFDEIVAFAEVERFLDTPVKRYSSGMYVRLAFAVAAHLEPDILVVDEVLAVGDAEFQRKCLGKMSQVAKAGRTVLFVSHHMAAVSTLCGRGVLLEQGRQAASGTITQALEAYLGSAQAASSLRFPPKASSPSIVGVRIDRERLKLGDLVVEIDFSSPFPLRPPIGGFVVNTPFGMPLFGSNTRFHDIGFSKKASLSHGTLRAQAERIPLAKDTYTISVWLADWHADYDCKTSVCSFDFPGWSDHPLRPPSLVKGYLDWPTRWKVDSESADGEQTEEEQLHSPEPTRFANDTRQSRQVDVPDAGR